MLVLIKCMTSVINCSVKHTIGKCFQYFFCGVAVCYPTHILLNLSMRYQTLNSDNFFPCMGLMGYSPDLLYKECPFQPNDTKFGLLPILSGYSVYLPYCYGAWRG